MTGSEEHLRPTPTDADLAALRAEVVAARLAVANERSSGHHAAGAASGVAADLLSCLEAYAAALESRRLPLPRRMQDELRLRRHLSHPRGGGGSSGLPV
jgi:hypothetical protein